MAIELSELIELLNKDLGLEYTVRVQYVQHGDVSTGAGSEAKESPQC